jgi:hypothetical protein
MKAQVLFFLLHPASYPMDTGVKAAGAWCWPLTSIYTEVKNA